MKMNSKDFLLKVSDMLPETDIRQDQDCFLSSRELVQFLAALPAPYSNEDLLDIDLRTLTYMYLCLCPEETQGDFAKKLGTNPATLSRALNSPNSKIKPEWQDGIVDILESLDVASFMGTVTSIANKQQIILEHKLNQKIPEYLAQFIAYRMYDLCDVPDDFQQMCDVSRFGKAYLFSDKVNHKWTWGFFDFDYQGIEIMDRTNPFAVATALSEVLPGFRATIFTRDSSTFHSFLSIQEKNCQDKRNSSYPQSVILIEYDGLRGEIELVSAST